MSDWTDIGLPCPLIAGYGYTRDIGLARTSFETAQPRQIQGWKDKRDTFQVSFAVRADQLAAIETFFAADAYGWFTMPLVSGDTGAIADVTVQAVTPYQLSPLMQDWWTLAFTVETKIDTAAPDLTEPGYTCVDEPCCAADDFQCCESPIIEVIIESIVAVWTSAVGDTITGVGTNDVGYPNALGARFIVDAEATPIGPIAFGQSFTVASFTHSNNVTFAGALTSAVLEITISGNASISGAEQTPFSVTSVYDFTQLGTANTEPCDPPSQIDVPCPDVCAFLNNQTLTETIDVGDVSVAFQMLGFFVDGVLLEEFITEETQDNVATLLVALQSTSAGPPLAPEDPDFEGTGTEVPVTPPPPVLPSTAILGYLDDGTAVYEDAPGIGTLYIPNKANATTIVYDTFVPQTYHPGCAGFDPGTNAEIIACRNTGTMEAGVTYVQRISSNTASVLLDGRSQAVISDTSSYKFAVTDHLILNNEFQASPIPGVSAKCQATAGKTVNLYGASSPYYAMGCELTAPKYVEFTATGSDGAKCGVGDFVCRGTVTVQTR